MWEYVKGSEADFKGAPDSATVLIGGDGLAQEYWAESFNKGAKYGSCYMVTNGQALGGEMDSIYNKGEVIAQRRKVDSLQSRVNDASLQQTMSNAERIRRETWSAVSGEPFAHLNDLPLVSERYDTVQRPAHYNQSGIECIDAIAASMTPVEFQAYLKGNVQKYLWRYQHKNGVEDCRKAQWYLDRLVKELSK